MEYNLQETHQTTEKGTEAKPFYALNQSEKVSFKKDTFLNCNKNFREINPLSLAENMMSHGIPYPTKPIGYGDFTRWGDVKDGRQKQPYWARRFQGGCVYGDWKTDQKYTWFEESYYRLSEAKRIEFHQKASKVQEDFEEQNHQSQNAVSQAVQAFWETLSEDAQSPYLEEKQVEAHGVRFEKKGQFTNLIVPLRDISGKLWSIQRIYEDGRKSFYTGGRKAGCFHVIGSLEEVDTGYVVEGYATGASVHKATQKPVIVAFDAGNMKKVVEVFRKEKPNLSLILAIDNDHTKEQNTGLKVGQELQNHFNLPMVVPEFTEEDNKEFYKTYHEHPSDFNDLCRLKGIGFVTESLKNVQEPPTSDDAFNPYQLITSRKDMKDGVYYQGFDKDGRPLSPRLVCSPLKIMAKTNDGQGAGWGYLLEWIDSDGKKQEWAMPASMLKGSGEEYRGVLLSGGLTIDDARHLSKYIQHTDLKERVRCTAQTGWHGKAFVLSNNTVIGELSGYKSILFQSEYAVQSHFSQKGTLEDWQQNIALYCKGNSRLMFAGSLAFAPCLLSLLGLESGGFHLRGKSSAGKSTVLKMSASVHGGRSYIRSWNATHNALEGVARGHNDSLLILDELAQVDPKQAGEIAYLLANEQGKGRSNKEGYTRKIATWKLLFLSAGEIGLSEHMRTQGKQSTAGQEVRLIDIPIDAGMGYGAFEDLHHFKDGATFSDHLTEETSKYYGMAGTSFIEKLITYEGNVEKAFKTFKHDFLQRYVPQEADGQIVRAATRFAVVAFAGELSTQFGITGWGKDEAEQAVATCFKTWLHARGGTESIEAMRLLKQISTLIETYGDSRFQKLKGETRFTISSRLGFTKGKERLYPESGNYEVEEYLIVPETFKSEFCKGFDPDFAIKYLIEKGILLANAEGKPYQRRHLADLGKRPAYVLSAQALRDLYS